MIKLTATELPRVMTCNGSYKMPPSHDMTDQDNQVRREGDAAHWLIDFAKSNGQDLEELIDRKAPNGVYITAEMVEFLQEYAADAMRQDTNIEVALSYGNERYQVRGRADLIRYEPETQTLLIGDLKYGWGIVEVIDNWTLLSHAVGWLIENHTFPVQTVRLKLYQPRPHHAQGTVRIANYSVQTIHQKAQQISDTLSNLKDELVTSNHCYKCPAMAHCPAYARSLYNGVDVASDAFVDTLDNDVLTYKIDQLRRLQDVVKHGLTAYEELLLSRLQQGHIVNGWSITHGLTNRAWNEDVTPDLLKVYGGSEMVKTVPITPNQAEKKGMSKELVASLTFRKQKGLKLTKIDAHQLATSIFEKDNNK